MNRALANHLRLGAPVTDEEVARAVRSVPMHRADGLFYNDLREPFISTDVTAVTLAATNKALYPASNFPVLGGQYFSRPGKKLRMPWLRR